MRKSSVARWMITHDMYVTGTKSPRAYFAAFLPFSLKDGLVERIACPTLVCDAEKDLYFHRQAQQLFDHLECPKKFMIFTDAEGTGAHCEAGVSRLAYARMHETLSAVN